MRIETGENVNLKLFNDVEMVREKEGGVSTNVKPAFEALSIAEVDQSLKVGDGVAWDFEGNGFIRGRIEDCTEDGGFILHFLNGRTVQVEDEEEVKEAKCVLYF